MSTKITSPVSQRRNQNPTGCLVLFGLIFFLIGSGVFFATFIKPLMQIMAARGWTPTPCTITSSAVGSHRGSKGSTTYSVDVQYTYQVNGQMYSSNRYWFVSGNSSSYSNKANIVATLPAGTNTTCYVNPNNPADAVLSRDVVGELFFGFFGLIFVAVGGGIMLLGIKSRNDHKIPLGETEWRPKNAPVPAEFTPGVAAGTLQNQLNSQLKSQTQLVEELQAQSRMQSGISSTAPFQNIAATAPGAALPSAATPQGQPVTLKPRSTRAAAFVALLLFSLFWNGIVSTFFFKGIRFNSAFDLFGLLFMTPFVLVGLGMLAATGYQFVAMFGPKIEVTISSASLAPGDAFTVNWQLRGNQRVQNLKIYLEGREEATYRRGTDTYTDRNTFCILDVAEAMGSGTAQGEGRVQIPAGTMHSFEAKNNKIIWQLVAKGEIPVWPDLKEEYPIVVLPRR